MEYVNLLGFVIEFYYRVDMRSGGVGVYINNGNKYKRGYDNECLY